MHAIPMTPQARPIVATASCLAANLLAAFAPFQIRLATSPGASAAVFISSRAALAIP